MKITVTFESLDEFKTYMGIQSPSGKNTAAEAAQEPQEQPKADTVKTAPPKVQKPQEGPTAAQAPAPGPDVNRVTGEPAVTEEDRVAVRKELAALNKKVGRNIARELIAGFGADKLTDVRLEDLPALMMKAREAAG